MCEPGIMFNTSMNNTNFIYHMEAESQLLILCGMLSGPRCGISFFPIHKDFIFPQNIFSCECPAYIFSFFSFFLTQESLRTKISYFLKLSKANTLLGKG